MSSCCSQSESPADRPACPQCGRNGVRVGLVTVKAMLTENALARVAQTVYWFCADAQCDVVYFSVDGGTYSKQDVRVPVWHKEPAGNRTVCYCFGETESAIRAEIRSTGQSEAVQRIRRHIDADRCACDVRNPRGVCCLGDVSILVRRLAGSLDF